MVPLTPKQQILNCNDVITKAINSLTDDNLGYTSTIILSQLRNFIDAICTHIYITDNPPKEKNHYNNLIEYKDIKQAIKYIKTKYQYRELIDFYNLLQISVSHYTLDEGNSIRVLLKYIPYLIKLKTIMEEFEIDILTNLDILQYNYIKTSYNYYNEIANAITKYNTPNQNINMKSYKDRFYVLKKHIFIINDQKYYELTVVRAQDNQNKFNRIVMYTDIDIFRSYAVELILYHGVINIEERLMNIFIIIDYNVSIRPCEFINYAKIFGISMSINRTYKEYNIVMTYLKRKKVTLLDIIIYDELWEDFKVIISPTSNIFHILKKSYDNISNNNLSSNILRYLLSHLNNLVIKRQLSDEYCKMLDNLYLNKKCISFAKLPFYMSLVSHISIESNLFYSIDIEGREHELLGSYIRDQTEKNGIIFHRKDDLTKIKENVYEIDDLITEFNQRLYFKHKDEMIINENNTIYRIGYINTLRIIFNKLNHNQNSDGIYIELFQKWHGIELVDSTEKQAILQNIFNNSNFACLYGPAGTGKTTFITYISAIFNGFNQLFLANTHTAVENLRNRINNDNAYFSTIAKIIKSTNMNIKVDLLIIDECSTISNDDICRVLEKIEYKYILFVGDPFQIKSIHFGNWFNYIIDKFNNIHYLSTNYRSTDINLLKLWELVRTNSQSIKEHISKCGYSSTLDMNLLLKQDNDQIILCLNYDGLFGINNINSILQANNTGHSVVVGVLTYKVNDPILFINSKMYGEILYNNLKGKILNIEVINQEDITTIIFTITVPIVLKQENFNKLENLTILSNTDSSSIIQLKIKNVYDTDSDTSDSSIIPFQLAYATSIHKAQGLEYDSVKIVISDELEEIITHDIFYTAITRSKSKLKIFWSSNTEEKILNQFKEGYNKEEFDKLEYKIKNE